LLHAYNVILDDTVQKMELQQAERLKNWHKGAWDRFTEGKTLVPLQNQQAAHLRGLIAVGYMLIDPAWQPGSEAQIPDWVEEELRRIGSAEGRRESEAWRRHVDYAVFRPRGVYAGSERLQNYFRSRTWWSRFPFRIDKPEEMYLAMVLADVCRLDRDYEELARPLAKLLGLSENPNLTDLASAFQEIWDGVMHGEQLSISSPFPHLPETIALLEQRFRPHIRAHLDLLKFSQPGELFGVYVLPAAYLFDSEVFTLTTEGKILQHHWPGGLDFMAALGSDLAETLMLSREAPALREPLRRALYKSRKRLTVGVGLSDIATLTNAVWEALVHPQVGPEHPPFMKTEAYQRKSLQTALAGWAEYRHRWVLQAQPSASLGIVSAPPGFVEPNLPFWNRLLDLTVFTHKVLSECGAEDPRLAKLAWTALQCRIIAQKQLANLPLSKSDREFFDNFADNLADLAGLITGSAMTERPQAVVADVHYIIIPRRVVHVGTGLPQAIYAIMPYQGKHWLSKGGVMTYREHVTEEGRTLTDDDWHAMLTGDKPPPQPEWTRDFCLPAKIEKRGEP